VDGRDKPGHDGGSGQSTGSAISAQFSVPKSRKSCYTFSVVNSVSDRRGLRQEK
jgi:hypothetical protein